MGLTGSSFCLRLPSYLLQKVCVLYFLIWRWKWTKPSGILPAFAAYSLITGCKNGFSIISKEMDALNLALGFPTTWTHKFLMNPVGTANTYAIPLSISSSTPVLTRNKCLNHTPTTFLDTANGRKLHISVVY